MLVHASISACVTDMFASLWLLDDLDHLRYTIALPCPVQRGEVTNYIYFWE